jgi:hypothetical protein
MEQNKAQRDLELDAMYNMASKFMNYDGPRTRKAMLQFANSSPAIAAKMGQYQQTMKSMVQKKPMKMDEGGFSYDKDVVPKFGDTVKGTMAATDPSDTQSTITEATNQIISDTAGDVTGTDPSYVAGQGTAGSATATAQPLAASMQAAQSTPGVTQTVGAMNAAQYQTQVGPAAQVQAAQANQSSVSGLQAAQGAATMMNNPVQRQIQSGELISGAADASKAAAFTEQIQAATASPSKQATVQGQLDGLMQDFDGGKTPAWAAGAMRAATSAMAARGLGASSLAGQAVVQAAMESALPIAQADAATQSRFESQNLSNRQQRAMLAAQQRAQFMGQEFDQQFQSRVANASKISDIANQNFTAEQQVALENSRAANTMNLANLGNSQAMVMAEASALANMDMANLSNRQQAAVKNAQAFLETDFRNMDRMQQIDTFKTQQKVAALFTDQAADNASKQFNASSENQTNQFFSNLETQTAQFNTAQSNAMAQFNVSSKDAASQFNQEMKNQRQQFNAKNGLVIAQANAQWRQNIATLNNAVENQNNMEYAKTLNNLTTKNIDAVWQRERDLMSYNVSSTESAKNRALELLKADMDIEAMREKIGYSEDAAKTKLAFQFLFGSSFGGLFG